MKVISSTLYYIADTRTNTIRVVTSRNDLCCRRYRKRASKVTAALHLGKIVGTDGRRKVNAAGDVFIADSGNQRIREVTGSSSKVAIINTILGGGNGGDGGATASARTGSALHRGPGVPTATTTLSRHRETIVFAW